MVQREGACLESRGLRGRREKHTHLLHGVGGGWDLGRCPGSYVSAHRCPPHPPMRQDLSVGVTALQTFLIRACAQVCDIFIPYLTGNNRVRVWGAHRHSTRSPRCVCCLNPRSHRRATGPDILWTRILCRRASSAFKVCSCHGPPWFEVFTAFPHETHRGPRPARGWGRLAGSGFPTLDAAASTLLSSLRVWDSRKGGGRGSFSGESGSLTPAFLDSP